MGGWRRSCALADLPGDVLALVADALALVGLRRPLLADDGGDLAHLLLGVALDDHAGRLRHLELDALRRLDRHRVRVAEGELEVGALELRAVADALDLERLGEAVGDAGDHVRDQRAREPVQRAVLRAVGRAGDDELLALLADLDRAVLALLEVAAGAGDAHDLGLDRHGDAGGDGDGPLTDSRHRDLPDLRDDLAADALPAGVVAGHHATRGRDDRGAHAAEHLGDGAGVHVGPLAGTRDALQARDHRLAALRVLQPDEDAVAGAPGLAGNDLVALDVALLREDPGHLLLELGRGDLDRLVRGHDPVADARQEVGDGVGHRHGATSSTSSCRGYSRCGPSPAGRCGRGRTCGRRRGAGRNGGSAYRPASCTSAGGSCARSWRSWPWIPSLSGGELGVEAVEGPPGAPRARRARR